MQASQAGSAAARAFACGAGNTGRARLDPCIDRWQCFAELHFDAASVAATAWHPRRPTVSALPAVVTFLTVGHRQEIRQAEFLQHLATIGAARFVLVELAVIG